jgi:hypothetical protein
MNETLATLSTDQRQHFSKDDANRVRRIAAADRRAGRDAAVTSRRYIEPSEVPPLGNSGLPVFRVRPIGEVNEELGV